jgi:hypothetical protein
VPGTVLPATSRWENEGTSEVVAAASGGTVGDGPTMEVEDGVVVLQAECTPDSTSVEHPQKYPLKVLT